MTLIDLLDGWSQKKKKPRLRMVHIFQTAMRHLRQLLRHETVVRVTAGDIVTGNEAMVANGELW